MKAQSQLYTKSSRIRKNSWIFNQRAQGDSAPIRKTNYVLNNSVSLIIYLISFFVTYYVRKGTFKLEEQYTILLGLLFFSLIFGSILSNKFIIKVQSAPWNTERKLAISLILTLGFLSIALLYLDIMNISRSFIIWAMFSGFMVESLYFYLISDRRKQISSRQDIQITFTYFLIDFLVLSIFCYSQIIEKLDLTNFKEKYYIMLAVIYCTFAH
ncbi:MAG: hypothetical protein HXY50_06495 [Ignavibacteriaceae bacterium]|nr:hypothetical protein [Ignavibacteriaceae bacterium]